jgi:hypothetical protein
MVFRGLPGCVTALAIQDLENGPSTALAAVQEPAERVQDYASRSKSAATIRAYASGWRDFLAFCAERELSALPASEQTDALYRDHVVRHLVAFVGRGIVRLAAGAVPAYIQADYTPPLADEKVGPAGRLPVVVKARGEAVDQHDGLAGTENVIADRHAARAEHCHQTRGYQPRTECRCVPSTKSPSQDRRRPGLWAVSSKPSSR